MLVSGLTRLVEEMELYGDLVRQEEGEIRVAVMLTDTGEEATLTLSDKIEVRGGSDEADLRMTMERWIFDEVLRGEADFRALFGRSRMSDVRPINFQFLKPERASAITYALKAMITFFTPGRVKVRSSAGGSPDRSTAPTPSRALWRQGLGHLAPLWLRKREVIEEIGVHLVRIRSDFHSYLYFL